MTTKAWDSSSFTIGLTTEQAFSAASLSEQLQILRKQLEAKDQQIASLQAIIQTLAEQQSPKYDLRGAQFSGGFAETVHGDQIGRIQQTPSSTTP